MRTVPHLLPESDYFAALPSVLATGYLVGVVEWTCMRALDGHLEDDEQTLGVHVDLSHQAPTSRQHRDRPRRAQRRRRRTAHLHPSAPTTTRPPSAREPTAAQSSTPTASAARLRTRATAPHPANLEAG
ncbi:hypothetical protein ABZ897_12775 [Nonomuraea sp. NPDC046802]|uniref:thioesterase family protein n=1 Tax=Nonomuraea sp. NPDC046802 TaxID=3154919 RepID=UPI0034054346